MKATINPSVFLKELKKIAPVIQKNTIVPINECVLLNFGVNELVITGTNFNTTVITKMECQCDKPFDLAISFNYISGICSKTLSPLVLTSNENNTVITDGSATFKLAKSVDAKYFSSSPNIECDFSIEVDGDFFFALSNAAKFVSKNPAMVAMTSVCIDFDKEKTSIVSTNANIFFKKDFVVKSKSKLRTSVGSAFVSIVKGFQESTISANDKFVVVESGNTKVIETQPEQAYINYSPLVKENLAHNVKLSLGDLKTAIDIVDSSADETTKETILVFNPANEIIDVQSKNIDNGMEAEKPIKAWQDIDIDSIKVNGSQLSIVLSSVLGEELSMFISGKKNPIYIQLTGDSSVLLLIMPLFQL